LLDHPLVKGSYDSVLLSALAVVGIRQDDGWETPDNYTGHYSAIIKIARMLVVRQSQYELEKYLDHQQQQEEQAGKEESIGLFSVVRVKVQRF
jgi:hypothetical protein